MYVIRRTSVFKKDVKRVKRQGFNTEELKTVIDVLVTGKPLEPKYKDHKLTGNWKKHRECHIKTDWLLIYRIDGNNLILVSTASHAELFDL